MAKGKRKGGIDAAVEELERKAKKAASKRSKETVEIETTETAIPDRSARGRRAARGGGRLVLTPAQLERGIQQFVAQHTRSEERIGREAYRELPKAESVVDFLKSIQTKPRKRKSDE